MFFTWWLLGLLSDRLCYLSSFLAFIKLLIDPVMWRLVLKFISCRRAWRLAPQKGTSIHPIKYPQEKASNKFLIIYIQGNIIENFPGFPIKSTIRRKPGTPALVSLFYLPLIYQTVFFPRGHSGEACWFYTVYVVVGIEGLQRNHFPYSWCFLLSNFSCS